MDRDGKPYPVNKFILAARSSAFEALFYHQSKKISSTYVMDCTAEEMSQFIKFIYTGDLEGQVISNDGFKQLIGKYKVKTLEILCRVASQEISLDNVAKLAMYLKPGPRLNKCPENNNK